MRIIKIIPTPDCKKSILKCNKCHRLTEYVWAGDFIFDEDLSKMKPCCWCKKSDDNDPDFMAQAIILLYGGANEREFMEWIGVSKQRYEVYLSYLTRKRIPWEKILTVRLPEKETFLTRKIEREILSLVSESKARSLQKLKKEMIDYMTFVTRLCNENNANEEWNAAIRRLEYKLPFGKGPLNELVNKNGAR